MSYIPDYMRSYIKIPQSVENTALMLPTKQCQYFERINSALQEILTFPSYITLSDTSSFVSFSDELGFFHYPKQYQKLLQTRAVQKYTPIVRVMFYDEQLHLQTQQTQHISTGFRFHELHERVAYLFEHIQRREDAKKRLFFQRGIV